jgi:hypothetical protein
LCGRINKKKGTGWGRVVWQDKQIKGTGWGRMARINEERGTGWETGI